MGLTGEFAFLARLLPRLPPGRAVLVGPGDDCAVVTVGRQRILLTTDALVEGIHFRRGWLSAYQLGRRLPAEYYRVRKPVYQLYEMLNHLRVFGYEYLKATLAAIERVTPLV